MKKLDIDEFFSLCQEDGLDFYYPTAKEYEGLDKQTAQLFSYYFLLSIAPLHYLEDPKVEGLSIKGRINAFFLNIFMNKTLVDNIIFKAEDHTVFDFLRGFGLGVDRNKIPLTVEKLITGEYTMRDVKQFLDQQRQKELNQRSHKRKRETVLDTDSLEDLN